VTLSLNSSIINRTPIMPTISGIDLNGAGNTTFPLSEAVPNLSYNCFNAGCGKAQLAAAVAGRSPGRKAGEAGAKALLPDVIVGTTETL
jgi:hypothetical protein